MSLRLKNVLESLKKHCSANKWAEISSILKGTASTSAASGVQWTPSLINTLLKVLDRDILSTDPHL